MKERAWMLILLILVATISGGLLGLLNLRTKPLIERNKGLKLKRTVLNALQVPYQTDNMLDKYDSQVEEKEIGNKTVYLNRDAKGKLSAVAFKIKGGGYQSVISAIIALKPDLKTIYGLGIFNQEETPGLGARIAEKDFLNQFVGKKIDPTIEFISRGSASEENEVDAITGATMTSNFLENIINQEVSYYRKNVLTTEVMEELANE